MHYVLFYVRRQQICNMKPNVTEYFPLSNFFIILTSWLLAIEFLIFKYDLKKNLLFFDFAQWIPPRPFFPRTIESVAERNLQIIKIENSDKCQKTKTELRRNLDETETELRRNWDRNETELRRNWDGTDTELRRNLDRTETKN